MITRIVCVSLIVVLLNGCASTPRQFFGIKQKHGVAKPIDITTQADGGFTFSYFEYYSSPEIKAFGTLSPTRYLNLTLEIYNESNSPLSTNYFLDEYAIGLKNGETHILSKPSITHYRNSNGYINPNSKMTVSFNCPFQLDEISTIVIKLGMNTYIRLQRIPTYSGNKLSSEPSKPQS